MVQDMGEVRDVEPMTPLTGVFISLASRGAGISWLQSCEEERWGKRRECVNSWKGVVTDQANNWFYFSG